MSDLACWCGERGGLYARADHSLVRYHLCREHLDPQRITLEKLVEPSIPPSMPVIFRETDLSRLHPKVQSVLDWTPDSDITGLLLHGTTGLGKTRGLWEIVRRMWVAETKKDKQLPFVFLSMRKLEGMIESSFEDRTHSEMIDGLITCRLLILDDFGKERLTSRMATDIFSIIDERSTNKRPTIISTNFNSSTMLERFEKRDQELGIALVRRLKDYYKIVGIV